MKTESLDWDFSSIGSLGTFYNVLIFFRGMRRWQIKHVSIVFETQRQLNVKGADRKACKQLVPHAQI